MQALRALPDPEGLADRILGFDELEEPPAVPAGEAALPPVEESAEAVETATAETSPATPAEESPSESVPETIEEPPSPETPETPLTAGEDPDDTQTAALPKPRALVPGAEDQRQWQRYAAPFARGDPRPRIAVATNRGRRRRIPARCAR